MPKFTLKTSVDKLDDVPEAYRERYTQRDDKKYYLDEIEVDDHAEVKSALERERADRRKAKEEAERLTAEFEKYKDIDPEKARAALDALEKAEEKKLKDKGAFDELLKAEQEKARKALEAKTTELGARDTQITELGKQLRKFKLDDKVRAAALKAGVLPDDLEDVMQLTAKNFDLGDDDPPVVLGTDGKPSSATLETFFGETFKTAKPKFYAPTGAGGSGAPAGGSGGGGGVKKTVTRADFDKLSPSERSAHLKDGGAITD